MIKLIKVTDVDINTRIDRWLKRNVASLNQSYLEKNFRKGLIKVNNKKISSNFKVKKNDIIKIYNFSEKNYLTKQVKKLKKTIPDSVLKHFNKSIIFQNENFIIIDKWDNIATQGGSKISLSINDIIKNLSEEYNLVHRLDIDTSGLLIISKNLKTTKLFGTLFREKKIKKIYFAVCNGSPKHNNLILKLKIPKKNDKGKFDHSITQYKVLFKNKKFSIILFNPLTGKKHQLRIVSKNIGCPIVGDKKYNINAKNDFEKLKLNSYSLDFTLFKKKYTFYSKLPKHFYEFFKKNIINFKNKNISKKLKSF